MRDLRIPIKWASRLLIGLGLLTILATAGSAILDAQQAVTPFDQVGDSGSHSGFVPVIAPPAGSPGQISAPTLPPRPADLNAATQTTPPTSLAPTSQPVTRQATLAPPPTATLALNTPVVTRPAPATPVPTASVASAWIPDRIVIPSIKLDAPVVPSKLQEIKYQDNLYRQWEAPNSFAAGWLTTSASLGVPGNTALSGHNNLDGEVFGHLEDLRVGDLILVYSGGRRFAYWVYLKMILPERFEPLAVRLANAEWILPSQDERLTLVTCWPYESNTHRLIIVATPISLNSIVSFSVTPRLTPHPPLSWMSTPTIPATETLAAVGRTATP
jgi:LPXTG-site transpeptidase (sortase) family protein